MANIKNSLRPAEDYAAAQEYYKRLKESLLNRVSEQYKIKMNKIDKQIIDVIKGFDADILMAASKDAKTAQTEAHDWITYLSKAVDKAIEKYMNGSTGELQKIYKDIETEIRNKELKIEEEKKKIYMALKDNRDNIYNQLFGEKNPISHAILTIKNYYNTNEIGVSDIESSLYSYFDRYIATRFSAITNERNIWSYKIVTGGYYRELAEYKALRKLLDKWINVAAVGSQGGTADVMFFDKTLTNMEQAFTENVNYSQKIDAANTILETWSIAAKESKVFAEQVKSWSLPTNEKITKNGLSIGHRRELLEAFTATNKSYSTENIAAFLGQMKNILATFGPSTVLFSTGNKRYWTYQFIEEFRKMQYYSLFKRNENGTPSSSIILDRIYIKGTNTLRKRYR